MIFRSLLGRGKSHILHQPTPHKLSSVHQHLFQGLVLKVKTQDFCTAGDDEGEKTADDDEKKKYRKKIEELRKLKKEMEELDKEFDSFFTVDYALGLAKKGFQDSDNNEDFVDSSESEKSDLEIKGPSKDELSPDEDDDDDNAIEDEDEDENEEDDDDDDDDDDNGEDYYDD